MSILGNNISKDISKFLSNYKDKLVKGVLPFYLDLEKSYSLRPGSTISYETKKERVKVERLIKQIEDVVYSGTIDRSSLSDIEIQIGEIEKELRFFKEQSVKDAELNNRLEELSKKATTNIDNLLKEQDIAKKRVGGSRPVTTLSTTEKAVWAALYMTTGPLAVAAKPVYDIGKYALSKLRKGKQQKSSIFESAVGNEPALTARSEPVLPKVEPIGELSKTLPSTPSEGANWPGRDPITGRFTSRKVSSETPIVSKQTAGQTAGDAVTFGLTKFFTKPAYNVPWTKELLEAVQGKREPFQEKKIKEQSKGSLLGDIVKTGVGLLAGGLALGLWDAFKAQQVSKEKGWLRKPGEELATGQKIASGVGGFLGGTGPGVFDKGTVGQKALNVGWGALKGGLIGGGIGALLSVGAVAAAPFTGGASLAFLPTTLGMMATGAGIGAGIGAGTHAVGGQKISQGLQATTRVLQGQDITTGQKLQVQNNPLEKIPATNLWSEVDKSIGNRLDKLYSVMDSMGNTIKEGSKGSSQKLPSGYDTTNTRNPILSSLGAGQLDIS